MQIKKVLQVMVDIIEPNEIYSIDIEKVILEKLTKKYCNRCYSGCLILRILRIIKRSRIFISTDCLNASAHVSVTFEIEGIVYIEGEIINGCKAICIRPTDITFSSKYAAGIVNTKNSFNLTATQTNLAKTMTQSIKENNIIPVMVVSSRYSANQNQITVQAIPLIPMIEDNTYYYINDDLELEDISKVKTLLEILEEELVIHDKMSKNKLYTFFKKMMNPYKTEHKFKDSADNSKFDQISISSDNLKALENIKNNILCLPLEEYISDNLPLFSLPADKINPDKFSNLINASITQALSEIIMKRLMYLQNIRGLAETYTADDISNMQQYWKVFTLLKKD